MFKKLYYKLFGSRANYKKYKLNNILNNQVNFFNKNIKKNLDDIDKIIKNKNTLNFLHSGHCGDLIYSLPVIKKLAETHKCNLFVGINKSINENYFKHPSKGVFIDKKIYNFIYPLLKQQEYINTVQIHSGEPIDINLDIFRELPINLSFNSCRWYFHITGIHVDLSKPFLDSPGHETIKDKIVIVRTFRSRNHFINYKFLNNFHKDLIFLGLKDEYEDLKQQIPKLNFYEPLDFYDMAKIINSSKFFLGNQSAAFAIAEGLKVPRLLECRPDFPVVQPIGGHCYDFYYQIHFKKFFNDLFKLKS